MKLEPARIPSGTKLPQKWGQAQGQHQTGQSIQQAEVRNHCRRDAGWQAVRRPASLAELGYNVKSFCIQDSPRRAHSVAAQGGINAAKNYQNDGDSVFRLFYDTIKGGDFRSREANVHRLAEVSVKYIDQCVAQGVPFAREYGGSLANRSFGGAQVSRTFYGARPNGPTTSSRGLSGTHAGQVGLGQVKLVPPHRDARVGGPSMVTPRASWCATLVTGEISSPLR